MKEENCLIYEDSVQTTLYPPKPVIMKQEDTKERFNIKETCNIVKKFFNIKRRSEEDFRILIAELNNVLNKDIKLKSVDATESDMFIPRTNTIILGFKTIEEKKKGSLITFLHEYQHALGGNEWTAVAWSLTIFKDVYPRSFAKLVAKDHCLKIVV